VKWTKWPKGEEAAPVQVKKAGFLTKIVVLVLLIAASVTLLRMQGQIAQAASERDALKSQVALQTQVNADLQDAIDHSDDPDRQADIARNELGLAAPGEKVIIFTD
jgi:cell division protein FtsL